MIKILQRSLNIHNFVEIRSKKYVQRIFFSKRLQPLINSIKGYKKADQIHIRPLQRQSNCKQENYTASIVSTIESP